MANQVRVLITKLQIELNVEIPKDSWYSITVKEFYDLVSKKLPDSHPKGALFISCRGREDLLPNNSLLSSYNVLDNSNITLLLKPKPRKINIYFHKQFYVDANISVQEALPYIHYALSSHDWVNGEHSLYIAEKNTSHSSIIDKQGEQKLLIENQFTKLKETDQLLSNCFKEPPYFLVDDTTPLLACKPTTISQFQTKGPKQKR